MSLYEASVPQMKKMLQNVERWLEKAAAHAKAKSFEPDVYVQLRLAPDQYPFVRQIQSACDSAKFTCARLAGKDPPKHPDTETTLEELQKRVRTVIAYLETFTPKDYQGVEDRKIDLPWMEGKCMRAGAYLDQMALPNFYFHLTTTYAILRHNGVPLGKMDYIGSADILDK
ncbi:MAG TPA: DUF1993 domain-containing protein [Labilithrix sp.]|jgi:hypothetical protein